MKKFVLPALLLLCFCLFSRAGQAAPLGRATADFDNVHPDKMETTWGRFVADAARLSTHTDIALVSAGSLHKGTLRAGPVDADDVTSLLAFPDDDLVTMKISGAQLRAGLERAVQAYPTASPAMLELSGLTAVFNAQAPINRRITLVRFHGAEVKDADTFTVVMPASLAEGGAGYYTIWNRRGANRAGMTLGAAVTGFVRSQGNITPDGVARLAAQ